VHRSVLLVFLPACNSRTNQMELTLWLKVRMTRLGSCPPCALHPAPIRGFCDRGTAFLAEFRLCSARDSGAFLMVACAPLHVGLSSSVVSKALAAVGPCRAAVKPHES